MIDSWLFQMHGRPGFASVEISKAGCVGTALGYGRDAQTAQGNWPSDWRVPVGVSQENRGKL